MEVLFEDEFVVVCVKPVGVLSQEANDGTVSMISLLREYCKTDIYPLHRLDREVGGVMVFAKNKTAASVLSKDIAEHRLKKEYIAFVHGKPENKKGEMCDLLFKDSKKNKSYVVGRERKGVKKAKLEYNLLETFYVGEEEYSKVLVLLHTGRTHQIRVQFSHRKMPLVADRKYGANDDFKNIGLHSYRITFVHPKTKELLIFTKESNFAFN